MGLRMATATKHPKTGIYYVRERVPADVRDKAQGCRVVLNAKDWSFDVLIKGDFLKRSLHTKDKLVATARYREVSAAIARQWQSLRDGVTALSHKEVHALVGEWRACFLAEFEDEPGEDAGWEMLESLLTLPPSFIQF